MRRHLLRAWPLILVPVVAGGAGFALGWERWGGCRATAWITLEPPAHPSSSVTLTADDSGEELGAFLESLGFRPEEDGLASPGSEGAAGIPAPEFSYRITGSPPYARLTVNSDNRKDAIRRLNTLAETAVGKWNRAAEDEEAEQAGSLESRIQNLEKELARLREEESTFRENHPEIIFLNDPEAIERETSEVAHELEQAKRSLASTEERRERLMHQLSVFTATTDEELLAEHDPVVAASASRLEELERKIQELRTRYTEQNPLVVGLLHEIAEEQKAYERAVAAARESGAIPEPPDVRAVRSDLASVEEKIKSRRDQVSSLHQKRDELASRNRRWQTLTPVVGRQLREFEDRDRRMESELRELREMKRIYTTAVARNDTVLPRLRLSRTASQAQAAGVSGAILGAVLGISIGLVLSLLAWLRRRRATVSTADALARQLGVPVLAVFPGER
jgi:flagellar biosynthesis chaperone FliJ